MARERARPNWAAQRVLLHSGSQGRRTPSRPLACRMYRFVLRCCRQFSKSYTCGARKRRGQVT